MIDCIIIMESLIDSYYSWGRYPRVEHKDVKKILWNDNFKRIDFSVEESFLPYGLGKSYGDSCLNENNILIDLSIFSFIPPSVLIKMSLKINRSQLF